MYQKPILVILRDEDCILNPDDRRGNWAFQLPWDSGVRAHAAWLYEEASDGGRVFVKWWNGPEEVPLSILLQPSLQIVLVFWHHSRARDDYGLFEHVKFAVAKEHPAFSQHNFAVVWRGQGTDLDPAAVGSEDEGNDEPKLPRLAFTSNEWWESHELGIFPTFDEAENFPTL
eukprot:3935665-Rhodomonas_salina.1